MMPTRTSDRRFSPRRRGLRGAPILAGLCTLALIAPAGAAAKKAVSASVDVDPGCGFGQAAATWTPVAGQAYVGVELSDTQTGDSLESGLVPVGPASAAETVDLGGLFSPLARGKHVVKATVTVFDAALNPLVSDRASTSMPCVLAPVIIPT